MARKTEPKVFVLKKESTTYKFLYRNVPNDDFNIVLTAYQTLGACADNPYFIMRVPRYYTFDDHDFDIQAEDVTDWMILDGDTLDMAEAKRSKE